MNEHFKDKLKELVELSKENVGYSENNVKFHFIIPLLECFGHNRLEFEHPAQTNRIDIYIKQSEKSSSCGFVIEAKNYDEKLDKHLDQLQKYSDIKRPFLAIISNGEEIRFYSPFWKGIPTFSDTLLYSIKRVDLDNDEIIRRLEKILSKENLDNELLHDYIDEREKEIKEAKREIESLTKEYKTKEVEISKQRKNLEDKINEIKTQISEKDNNIHHLKKEEDDEIKKLNEKYRLPIITSKIDKKKPIISPDIQIESKRVPIISLSTLINYGKLKVGDKLIFCIKKGKKLYPDEYVIVERDGLRYRDDKLYSANLASDLRHKLHITPNKQATQGPIFWITENGKLLDDLNNEVREEMKSKETNSEFESKKEIVEPPEAIIEDKTGLDKDMDIEKPTTFHIEETKSGEKHRRIVEQQRKAQDKTR